MPASPATNNAPDQLLQGLRSSDWEVRLKALRELKNQIIGNRTKKIFYVKLGAVPRVVEVLTSCDSDSRLLIQAAAILGSFACGPELGIKAILSSDALAHLIPILSHNDEKAVDACARALRMIFQSKLAPKYDLIKQRNLDFLVGLLNSDRESATELAACIVAHSCKTSAEQKALFDAGVVQKLIILLAGSINQRDAALNSLAAIFKGNSELVSKWTSFGNGRSMLKPIIDLIRDKYPRTRLVACICLIVIWKASHTHTQDSSIKRSLISVLIELLEEPGLPGDDAPFALADLMADNEDLQRVAVGADATSKLCNYLLRGPMQAKRLQGTLLSLSVLCSRIENCRCQIIQPKVLDVIIDALRHQSLDVCIAACTCLRSITRSIKSLSAGVFTDTKVVSHLVQLLSIPLTSLQVATLGAMSNIMVDFSQQKGLFIQVGAVRELVQLSRSMDPVLRLNATLALRNSMFLADIGSKDTILSELTVHVLSSLICDSESSVQEQAIGLVCNLVNGSVDSIDRAFAEDGLVIKAVVRQLGHSNRPEVCIQGMYTLNNIACGTELHKATVVHYLLQNEVSGSLPLLTRCLQSGDSKLRVASAWCVVNLTNPSASGVHDCVSKLRDAGIINQIKSMLNDPCSDVKFRVRTILSQWSVFEMGSM